MKINQKFEINPKISENFYETAARISMYDTIKQLLQKAKNQSEEDSHNCEYRAGSHGKLLTCEMN